jgi:single-stranded DNA-binding protein
MKTNTATILGHVGFIRLFQHENKPDLLAIDVACNSKAGDKEYVDWYKVKVWGALATKLASLIQKGDKLLVNGRPEAKGYLRKDGTAGADLLLHADDVQLLTARSAAAAEPVANAEELPP